MKTAMRKLLTPFFGLFLMLTLAVTPIFTPKLPSAYADPAPTTPATPTSTPNNLVNMQPVTNPTPGQNTENTENAENTEAENEEGTEEENKEEPKTCYDQVEGIAWLVCPVVTVLSGAVDGFYGFIEENFLSISPLTSASDSPIYLVWQYARDITNIVFVIFILVIIWSQLTGLGISNYGIKKTLPRIVIAAIMVNLSYIICAVAVDISNILGFSIKSFLATIAKNASQNTGSLVIPLADLFTAIFAGGSVAGIAIAATGGIRYYFFLLAGIILSGVISLGIGLITIAMRQALVAALVMISPLAFVCYLLPNTERLFNRWKNTLFGMLVFYPAFALLFGASQLAGWAIASSSSGNLFLILVGVAVQIIPIFMSISLMKMSHTALGKIHAAANKLTIPARRGLRGWSASHALQQRERYLANSSNGGARLRRYLDYRSMLRNADTANNAGIRRAHAEILTQRRISMGTADNAYDTSNPDQQILTDEYVRNAKLAMSYKTEAQIATLDAQHILNNYSKFHNKTEEDQRIIARNAQDAKNYTSAEFASVSDNIADSDWIASEFLRIYNAGPDNNPEYRRYIDRATGSLGEGGRPTVLGMLISKAAKNEAERRSYVNKDVIKYNFDKGFRDFLAGYYVNDDGYACFPPDPVTGKRELVKINARGEIDPNGRPERWQGEFRHYHPEVLVRYDRYTEVPDPTSPSGFKRRYYYDAKDSQGKVYARFYDDDSAAIKELISNFDMPIQDGVNDLYALLAGRKNLDGGVDCSRYRSTIARSIIQSKYSDKAAHANPFYATAIANGVMHDDVQQNLIRLSSISATSNPTKFNKQDKTALTTLGNLIDMDNWDEALLNAESLKDFANVNSEKLDHGIRVLRDADGRVLRNDDGSVKTQIVPREEATDGELQNAIQSTIINKAARTIALNMKGVSPRQIDEMKPSAAAAWVNLYERIQKLSSEARNASDDAADRYLLIQDPLRPQNDNDVQKTARVLRSTLKSTDSNPPAQNAPVQVVDNTVRVDGDIIQQVMQRASQPEPPEDESVSIAPPINRSIPVQIGQIIDKIRSVHGSSQSAQNYYDFIHQALADLDADLQANNAPSIQDSIIAPFENYNPSNNPTYNNYSLEDFAEALSKIADEDQF